MKDYKLLWGDFHTHLTDFDRGDEILEAASRNIDFTAVLCYPFVYEWKNGLHIESVKEKPEFAGWWKRLQELCRTHHQPGRFVTFLGYEWHGNRTRYGDHNVIYFDETGPLDDAWTLEELYVHLKERRAIAIPHHTAYCPNWRSKNWDIFDENLSPIMEIFSVHGSSEGCNTPLPLENNSSMGPRTTGGSFQDALARGYHIGVIGSNDGPGLPGRWGRGRAAVWATECTREAIWEAILARRTYAVTGDRIELKFQVAGAEMGSVTKVGGKIDAEVSVVGSGAIDRIELLQNGLVVDTYCHSGCWETKEAQPGRFKVFIEAGWGPAQSYGHKVEDWKWDFRLDISSGRIVGLEKCFTLSGQRVISLDESFATWELLTAGRITRNPFGMRQGLIFEIEGTGETELGLKVEGLEMKFSAKDLLTGSHLIPLTQESKERILRSFGLSEEDVVNPDTYYHNARKVKIHEAIPESGYRIAHTFKNLKLAPGRNSFYLRVSQLNGQLAWSSPIWVDAE